MQFFIYPDGSIFTSAHENMSDDFFVIDTSEPVEKTKVFIETIVELNFGKTKQAKAVLEELLYRIMVEDDL